MAAGVTDRQGGCGLGGIGESLSQDPASVGRRKSGRHKVTIWRLLQLIGAGCVVVVVLTHVAKTFKLFPVMGWGLPTSPDITSIS